VKKNTKVLFGGGIIGAAILLLLVAATPGSSGVEVSIQQIKASPAQYSNGNFVTTQGTIIGNSIKWDPNQIMLNFDIKDDKGKLLHVIHHGVKPDNFSEGIIAILEGTVNPNGDFVAETVKTRCPSKYEGRDPKGYDPEFHKQLQNKSTQPK
jgi:cytochrome c-type biogenesis protein CcmE